MTSAEVVQSILGEKYTKWKTQNDKPPSIFFSLLVCADCQKSEYLVM